MENIFIVLLGLIVGSFLNVVIYRLPLGRSLVAPRSACPACNRQIAFYDNIPVISFIILRGRCRGCRKRISIQYPLVELLTAFSFWLTYRVYGSSVLYSVFVGLFLCIIIALALIDLKHMILPDQLTLGGGLIFLLFSFFNPEISVLNAFGSAFGSALVFAALYFFYLKVRKIEGLGFGDVKMMILLGAFLGIQKLLVALMIASISGLVVGIFLIVFRKKNLRFQLPFGTFLGIGSYVAAFWGYDVLKWVQSLFQ